MANDSGDIVVAANGQVHVGALGATAPTTADDALGAAWTHLGLVSENGATISDSKNIEDIGAWQSFYPVRRIVASREFTIAFVLRQWNEQTVPFAFGGGAITGTTDFTYTPPAPEDIDERALSVSWQDGDRDFRLYVPKGMVTENVETNLTRTSAADLPITFSVTPEAGDDPYLIFTTDPTFLTGS
jgi:hypothetical protein